MEWTERASRLFVTADTRASDLTPREQLVRALDLWESESWMRVILALDEQQLRDLALADVMHSMAPLDQVRRASEAVALALGEESVVVGMVALGLGITAARCTNETLERLGESFGMPSMTVEDIAGLRHTVHGRLYFPEDYPEDEPAPEPGDESLFHTTARAVVISQAAGIISVGVRVVLGIAFLTAAVRGRDWVLAACALTAFGATQRPQHDAELMMSHSSRPGVVPTRQPLMLWVALLLMFGNYTWFALAVILVWFTVRVCAHVGEYVVGSGAGIMVGPSPFALRTSVRPANRYIVRRQVISTVVTVGAGVVALLSMVPAALSAGVPLAQLAVGALWAAIASEKSIGLWSTTSKRFRFASAPILFAAAWTLEASGLSWPMLIVPPVIATIAMRIDLHLSRPRGTPLVSRREAGGRRDHRHWRQIADGRSGQVLTDLEGVHSLSDSQRAALAVAAVLEGHPARARNVARAITPGVLPEVRHLVDARAHTLLGTRPEAWPEDVRLDTELGRATRLAWLQASSPFTDPIETALGLVELLPHAVTRRSAFFAMDTYLAIGETLSPVDPTTAAGAVSRVLGMVQVLGEEEVERMDLDEIQGTVLTHPMLHRMFVRCMTFVRLWAAGEEQVGVSELLEEDALEMLIWLTNPYEVARYCNGVADLQLLQQGRVTGDGLELRTQAFASLNVIRHRLTDPDDRALWWGTFTRTLDALLDESWRYQDWRLLLEVIEAARLQLGTSREDLRPTALSISGTSKVANQRFAVGDRPTLKAIESVVAVASGGRAWWWATHVSQGHLYWAVSGPGLAAHGGRIDAAELESVLEALDRHLVSHHPEESTVDYARRLHQSALFRAPSNFEARLAGRVGTLLPEEIRSAMKNPTRGTICMSLAPEIAHIPWAWVKVGERRLVEAFDTVIVPPASLVPDGEADANQLCPIEVAVVNPGDDLAAAEQSRDLLPAGVQVIDSATTSPISRLGDLLQGAPYDSTLFLACHTTEVNGQRGFAFAPLAGITKDDVLLAADLAREKTAHPMPRQVIALACSSADLSGVSAGEWTVLGTSLIQAGARRALVTAFPIFNLTEVDQTFLSGTQSGEPLHVTLARLQQAMLDRWRRRDATAAPLRWAGLQLFGTLATGDGLIAQPAPPRWVHTSFIEALDSAAWWAPKGATAVGPRDLMRYFAVFGHIDGMPRKVRARVWRRFLSVLPTPLSYASLWVRHRGRDGAPPRTISPELWAIVEDAERLAREMGRHVVDVDHLFVAALRSDNPDCAEMRNLTGMDTRNPTVLHHFLDDARDIMFSTGEVKVNSLAPYEVERVYALFGVTPPVGEDRWAYNERLT